MIKAVMVAGSNGMKVFRSGDLSHGPSMVAVASCGRRHCQVAQSACMDAAHGQCQELEGGEAGGKSRESCRECPLPSITSDRK